MTIESVSFCEKVAEVKFHELVCLSLSVFPLTTFPLSYLHTNSSLLKCRPVPYFLFLLAHHFNRIVPEDPGDT